MTKWCTRCQDHRPVDEFSPRRRGHAALRSWCNPCVAESCRARMDDLWPEWRAQAVLPSTGVRV